MQVKEAKVDELGRQVEAAASVRDSIQLVEHIKRCINWNLVWEDRAAVAELENKLQFVYPDRIAEVR